MCYVINFKVLKILYCYLKVFFGLAKVETLNTFELVIEAKYFLLICVSVRFTNEINFTIMNMKTYLVLIVLLVSSSIFSQNASKASFQKNKYDLAISYYKKAELSKALDEFSIACKIYPENEVGKEAMKKITVLKSMLRKDLLARIIGNWRFDGNKPTWAVKTVEDENRTTTELLEINEKSILFNELDKKTKLKKYVKSEDLVFYENEADDSLFSAIILSDGTIWICSINEEETTLKLINIARKDNNAVEKIRLNNLERYYTKVI